MRHPVLADDVRRATSGERRVGHVVQLSATAERRMGVVLVRCPHELAGPYGLVAASIVDTLERGGLVVRLSTRASSPVDLAGLPERTDVCGAILVDAAEPPPLLRRLLSQQYPCVLIETGPPPMSDVAAVWSDQGAGVRSVMAHLQELGHRRIAAIAQAPDGSARGAWLADYAAAVRDAGLESRPDFVYLVDGPDGRQSSRAAGIAFGSAEPPTAVVCDTQLAAGVLHAADAWNLRVPKDVSIVGFNDAGIGAFTRPALTAVRHAWSELGHLAATALLEVVREPAAAPVRVPVPPVLVVRGSTGQLRGDG